MQRLPILLLSFIFMALGHGSLAQLLVPVNDQPPQEINDSGDCFICDDEISITVNGPSTVEVGDQDIYTLVVLGVGSHTATDFDADKGTVVSESHTSATISWTTMGAGRVYGSVIVGNNYHLFSKDVNVTATPPATPPTPFVSSNLCGPKTVTRSNPPSGVTYYWQTSSSGTSRSNSASTYNVTASRTVYLRARDNSTGLWSSARSVYVTVIPNPAAPPAPVVTETGCGSTTITIGSAPSGTIWAWQTSPSGADGSNTATTRTFTTSQTVYLRARDETYVCWSPAVALEVIVEPIPITSTTPDMTTECGVTTISPTPTTQQGVTFYWQTDVIGTSVAQPASAPFVLTDPGAIYIRGRSNVLGCWGGVRQVMTEVAMPPAAPSEPVISYPVSGGVTLSRQDPPDGVTWYWQGTDSEGTTAANSAATFPVSTSGTYYLRSRTGTSCWGPAIGTAVTIQAQRPFALTAFAQGPSQIQLVWQGEGNETGFVVLHASSADGPYTAIHTTAGNVTTYLHNELASASTHYYIVQAKVGAEHSFPSAYATATTESLDFAGQHNGNISAIRWKNKGQENVSMYSYTYDLLNRLNFAYYQQGEVMPDGTLGNLTRDGDFSVSGIRYDLNGNINQLTRNGLQAGAPQVIDQLSYTYQGNRLQRVEDFSGEEGFTNGHSGTNTDPDYTYDNNGNMTQDLNKDITSITYNRLNLPEVVTKADGSYLKYYYDATGVKLAQEAYSADGTLEKRTDYLGSFVFENDEVQFMMHEEGRLVPNPATGDINYEYFLRDHLGNNRVVFTTDPNVVTFTLNYEGDENNPDDAAVFTELDHIVEANVHDHTDAGTAYQNSQRLTGGKNAVIGSVLSIPVAAGDKVSASVHAKYLAATGTSNPSIAVGNLLAAALSGTTGTNTYEGAITNSYGSGGSMITNVFQDEVSSTEPKAFLNLLFLPEQESGVLDVAGNNIAENHFAFKQIGPGSSNAYAPLILDEPFEAPSAGHVVVYLSNESDMLQEVYFDDLQVNLEETAVVQVSNYYPFGLTFDEYQRVTAHENKYKFQGQENVDDLGLNWDAFKWRNHQPEIGRFFNIDPLAEQFYHNSVYAFSENKVTNHIELEGLEAMRAPLPGQSHNELKRSVEQLQNSIPGANHLSIYRGRQEIKGAAKVYKGVQNTAFGLVGVLGSSAYLLGTEGIGAALGGSAALTLSIGEVSIGVSQIADGAVEIATGEALPQSDLIQSGGSLIGLGAKQLDAPNPELFDAVGQLAPGTLSGGNVKSLVQSPKAILESKNGPETISNVLQAIDSYLDITGFIDAAKESLKGFFSNDDPFNRKKE